MNASRRQLSLGFAAGLAVLSATADATPEFSPALQSSAPSRVFWGDTHLHTSYSTDAGMIGNRVGPDEALRFAKGEAIVTSLGMKAKLQRPLDFLVVSDHAENIGLAPMIAESNDELLKDPWGKAVHDLVKAGKGFEAFVKWATDGMVLGKDPMPNPALMRIIWDRIIDAVNKHNQPGVFTAFHGFEWTASPMGSNLHRNVIFRDGKDKVSQVLPLSNYNTQDPERLWDYLEAYEKQTGGKVLAIPHNGNLSNGLMFDDVTFTTKKALDRAYAERRMRWEPIYEVTQIKGDGETHPALSASDEFADYYRWDKGDFGVFPKTPEMLPREYARQALGRGLAYDAALGVNPFKFGMIGSTDSHTSMASSEEDNYFGKFSGVEPGSGARRYSDPVIRDSRPGKSDITIRHYQSLASGLAGVWAQENTREALWDAMARKEVYATTGTRMTVRLFGGWDFSAADIGRSDLAAIGYRRGVPMGGDLKQASAGKAPSFLVSALRDPMGANLDRIQMVKGWVDAAGKPQEKVYDVAWAGRSDNSRKPGKNGKLPPVGNTVDVANATWSNRIGQGELAAWWRDPSFDPAQRAFYYVRVLEIPTPTWLAYDRKLFDLPLPKDALLMHQERAYTSPIWYSPN